jgi:hypothetical protein
MSLPPDLFNEITQSITIVGHEEPAEDGARQTPRFQLRTHVTLLPWNDPSNALSVRIRDLSTDGLGVLHTQRMPLDDQFVICFPKAEQTILALYTIVYWEPLAENLYAIGAHFDRLIEQSDLEARKSEVAANPIESRTANIRLRQIPVRNRKAS